ncbi:MAG: zinc transporter ZupT, partial [Rikenellaceae bacterium]|nr:zinc transporter ZupT [Rikenellaceae bacterium]
MTQQVIYAFLITLAAGLATGIGSVIAFMTKRTNRRFLAFSLGLSAGVMIYVSVMEMLYSARVELAAMRGEQQGALITAAAFFGGMLIAYLIDRAVPEAENPHELHSFEELEEDS